ncbi:unnamed protein product [Hydatigera taeniaeformis]|uniref:Uncharacterized protein n=1 Tax=Hydatigena taeniaeformis TaxID=6205 RepID=A0A0R3X2A2_HYDTA|nr:unnamed protein product [Hydatigera taeniaeformis]
MSSRFTVKSSGIERSVYPLYSRFDYPSYSAHQVVWFAFIIAVVEFCLLDDNAMYEVNRAFLDPYETSSPTLSSPTLSSTESLNSLYMFNTAHDLSDTGYKCGVSSISPTSNAERVIEGAEPLNVKTARSIALAVLSRIARLLSITLNELLTALLPLSSSSFGMLQSSLRCEWLVEWGRMIHGNIIRTDANGFVEGIPVGRVVKSSALAYLRALADWPTKANRVQLLEESGALMVDFLTTASTGFFILQSQQSGKTLHFMRLVELILCGFNHSCPAHLAASRLPKDPNAVNEHAGSERDQFAPVDTTIPFIDESYLNITAIPCDSPLAGNCHLSSVLEQSPSNISGVCIIDAVVETGVFSSSGTPTQILPPSMLCGYFNGAATAMAIQLALLLLPSELRFQIQLFVEQAQKVTANAARHIRPEKTLHYVQPDTLAKWFAPRFFGFSTNASKSSGHNLLEYILSFPQALQLLKPPSYLDLGLREWDDCFLEDFELYRSPSGLVKVVDRRPSFGSASSPPTASTKPLGLEQVLALGNMRHLILALNYFIDNKSMDPKTKMRYIKQFEVTHPDVFWLRFGDSQTAHNYYAHLRRRIDQLRDCHWRGQSRARLIGRLGEIFKLRGHLLTKKPSLKL